jgi:hypothetical protein
MAHRRLEIPIIRILLLPVLVASLALLNGCGGNAGQGGGMSSNAVNVSLAASSVAAAAPATAGGAPGAARPAPPGNIDHAWITVHRIALLPADPLDPASGPDPAGEAVAEKPGGPVAGMVGSDVPPTEVDLLNLPAGEAARFLNALGDVPAGRYHKIRLYYTDPKVHFIGDADNTAMHATAHFHLDIHFVGGDLVIPVGTDPAGGVQAHDVSVVFVLGKDGLKINVNPGKILMRPQVFARVSAVEYVVTGLADNVDKVLGSFDIATAGGASFHVDYDSGTAWLFRDDVRWVWAGADRGIPALRDGALLDVIGRFDALRVLQARDVLITLPDSLNGKVFIGWKADNTFELRIAGDNTVFPVPGRTSAYYDNAVTYALLSDSAIADNVAVTARGYARPGEGIDAFWISVGP